MSDDQRLQQQPTQRRHNCCRLCLAPDNECISILNSYAADKEPLATKIHSCVSIKVSTLWKPVRPTTPVQTSRGLGLGALRPKRDTERE